MSTSKYANLPDVDTSAADIFETEDVAYTASNNQDAYDSDDSLSRLNMLNAASGTGLNKDLRSGPVENIDASSLPPRREAGKVFGKRSKGLGDNASTYTFRPRLPALYLKGEGSFSDSDSGEDSLGTGSTAQRTRRFREDPVNKLRRLKLECLELQRQLEHEAQIDGDQKDKEDGVAEGTDPEKGYQDGKRKHRAKKPDTQALLAQLLELRTGLDKTEQASVLRVGNTGLDNERLRAREEASKGLVDRLGAKSDTPVAGQVQPGKAIEVKPSPQTELQDVQVATELDRRLDLLEKRIGAGIDTASAPVPILSSLSRLESILTMLSQPDQLDGVSTRVKLVLADLDKTRATPNNKSGISTDKNNADFKLNPSDAQKVEAIYTALPRIEPLVPLLPPLLTRLRSLASLHAGASSVQSTLTRLEIDTADMKETDSEIKEVLDRLDEGISKQAEAMKGNWDSLSERLELLNERVAKLHG
ncbi:Dynamitin-domain-containing protein [Filobasidium floriforme]|uniref:Dynamitin-domain-containing protein n=1 Tax=Filobasidium floriforme TaxID=5210 RepID=UPI001E8E2169|nr:Dynamitin-domain-containing protein [Filobasidium floriforme]KAH8089172.1 Dynamitin-domain-containing protein [Filobasidium floriforme]